MNEKTPIFTVWQDASQITCAIRTTASGNVYSTSDQHEAEAVARKLALQYAGNSFYVMKGFSVSSLGTVTTSAL